MSIAPDVRYIGVNDHRIDLFEGQYPTAHGMAYNSYIIFDEKTAVMDSVSEGFAGPWLSNIQNALDGGSPDYLIVQHMEPDHSGSLAAFMRAYPSAIVVASAKAFSMMETFFGEDYAGRRIIVIEGSTLPLGRHTLRFIAAPMVHWPEVIMTYDMHDKTFYSADAFGKFGVLDTEAPWKDEARRYYTGIVGRYGAQVQALLKKAYALDIARICPLHGPVLSENLPYYLNLYDTWSAYRPEESGVAIVYTSIYGHTKEAVERLTKKLLRRGVPVAVHDLSRGDMFAAVADAFRFDRLVLATTTYNADVFPFMKTFIHHLTERNFRSRKVGLIENGSWAPVAAKIMRGMLENSKNLAFTDTTVCITSALNEKSLAQIDTLADELV